VVPTGRQGCGREVNVGPEFRTIAVEGSQCLAGDVIRGGFECVQPRKVLALEEFQRWQIGEQDFLGIAVVDAALAQIQVLASLIALLIGGSMLLADRGDLLRQKFIELYTAGAHHLLRMLEGRRRLLWSRCAGGHGVESGLECNACIPRFAEPLEELGFLQKCQHVPRLDRERLLQRRFFTHTIAQGTTGIRKIESQDFRARIEGYGPLVELMGSPGIVASEIVAGGGVQDQRMLRRSRQSQLNQFRGLSCGLAA